MARRPSWARYLQRKFSTSINSDSDRPPPKPEEAALAVRPPHDGSTLRRITAPGSAVGGPIRGLAGHTHGGQIRFPGFPPLWLPSGSGAFASGWYPKGKNRLYVSRGIGVAMPPVRFACRPELAIFGFVPG